MGTKHNTNWFEQSQNCQVWLSTDCSNIYGTSVGQWGSLFIVISLFL